MIFTMSGLMGFCCVTFAKFLDIRNATLNQMSAPLIFRISYNKINRPQQFACLRYKKSNYSVRATLKYFAHRAKIYNTNGVRQRLIICETLFVQPLIY